MRWPFISYLGIFQGCIAVYLSRFRCCFSAATCSSYHKSFALSTTFFKIFYFSQLPLWALAPAGCLEKQNHLSALFSIPLVNRLWHLTKCFHICQHLFSRNFHFLFHLTELALSGSFSNSNPLRCPSLPFPSASVLTAVPSRPLSLSFLTHAPVSDLSSTWAELTLLLRSLFGSSFSFLLSRRALVYNTKSCCICQQLF